MRWLVSVVLCSALLVSNAYAAPPDRPRVRRELVESTGSSLAAQLFDYDHL